jgi:hypothetical protein
MLVIVARTLGFQLLPWRSCDPRASLAQPRGIVSE